MFHCLNCLARRHIISSWTIHWGEKIIVICWWPGLLNIKNRKGVGFVQKVSQDIDWNERYEKENWNVKKDWIVLMIRPHVPISGRDERRKRLFVKTRLGFCHLPNHMKYKTFAITFYIEKKEDTMGGHTYYNLLWNELKRKSWSDSSKWWSCNIFIIRE